MNAAPEDFYDSLATKYDAMTNFATRLDGETQILRPLVQDFSIRRAADMGCGTGLHVFALSRLGIEATGFDISGNMIRRAQQHASEMKIAAQFFQQSFLAPELETLSPWDAVFCLGNSLPHVASHGELSSILRHWKRCLSHRGVIIIQLLNYLEVLRAKNRIIGVRKSGATTIIRFYDFTEPELAFNILTITEEGGGITHDLQSTQLLPFTRATLATVAEEAGFSRIDCYSDLERAPFSDDAKDLVIILGNSF